MRANERAEKHVPGTRTRWRVDELNGFLRRSFNRGIGNLMCEEKQREIEGQLAALRSNDQFRKWHSLDDERVCVLCERTFTGHEVKIIPTGRTYQLRCPTPGSYVPKVSRRLSAWRKA